jgi:rare lipoprotein A
MFSLGATLAISACTTGPPPIVVDAPPAPSIGGGIYKVGDPYEIAGVWYYPREEPDYDETGIGSWYGAEFDGRATANGEIFDRNAITAAHPTLPMPVNARVTNLENGRSLVVRINDRGPFVNDRVIDLSEKAADLLGYRIQGTARVRVTYLGRAELNGLGTLSIGEATPIEVATAVPAAPTDVVASNTLAPVAGAAIAPERAVEALPRPALQEDEAVPTLAGVDGVVIQMAGFASNEIYAPADALVLNEPAAPPQPPAPSPPSNVVVAAAPAIQALPALPVPLPLPKPEPEPLQLASASIAPVQQTQLILRDEVTNEIYVQAGAFDNFTNANRVASRLASAGARISQVTREEGTVFRVRLGPFRDVETADSVLNQVQSAGHANVDHVIE